MNIDDFEKALLFLFVAEGGASGFDTQRKTQVFANIAFNGDFERADSAFKEAASKGLIAARKSPPTQPKFN